MEEKQFLDSPFKLLLQKSVFCYRISNCAKENAHLTTTISGKEMAWGAQVGSGYVVKCSIFIVSQPVTSKSLIRQFQDHHSFFLITGTFLGNEFSEKYSTGFVSLKMFQTTHFCYTFSWKVIWVWITKLEFACRIHYFSNYLK